MQSASKFTVDLSEAVAGMQSVLELRQPDLALLEGVDGKPGSFGRAAANETVVAHCNELLLSWCTTAEEALGQSRQQAAEVSLCYFCTAAVTVLPDGKEVWDLAQESEASEAGCTVKSQAALCKDLEVGAAGAAEKAWRAVLCEALCPICIGCCRVRKLLGHGLRWRTGGEGWIRS